MRAHVPRNINSLSYGTSFDSVEDLRNLGLFNGKRSVLVILYRQPGANIIETVDRVKAKSSSRLQRERNLEADPRAALLVEHWDRGDWSRLWWVRAELRWQGDALAARTADLAARLASAYPQYRDQPFTRVLVFRVVGVTGWAAGVR